MCVCVIRCVYRFAGFSLYVIDMVLKFLFYVDLRKWPAAAVNYDYFNRYIDEIFIFCCLLRVLNLIVWPFGRL